MLRRGVKQALVWSQADDFRAAGPVGQDDCADPGMGFAVRPSALQAENEERGGQGVGFRGGGGDGGSAGRARGRPASARVENVAELLAFVDQVLVRRRRSAEGLV